MWAKLLKIPAYAIYGAIMVFATLGSFAPRAVPVSR